MQLQRSAPLNDFIGDFALNLATYDAVAKDGCTLYLESLRDLLGDGEVLNLRDAGSGDGCMQRAGIEDFDVLCFLNELLTYLFITAIVEKGRQCLASQVLHRLLRRPLVAR